MEEKEMEKSYTSIFGGAKPVDTTKRGPRLTGRSSEGAKPCTSL